MDCHNCRGNSDKPRSMSDRDKIAKEMRLRKNDFWAARCNEDIAGMEWNRLMIFMLSVVGKHHPKESLLRRIYLKARSLVISDYLLKL